MRSIVILKPCSGATLEAIGAVLPREEPALWAALASGACRGVHYDESTFGAVLLEFETDTAEQARAIVEAFPLVREGLHEAEVHPLRPYSGLALLFRPELGFVPELPAAWIRSA